MPRRLSVTFRSRPVESFRGRWWRCDEAVADPGVAGDIVASFEPRCGPSILRVCAQGGEEHDRRPLVGDWLCEGPPAPNLRVPDPLWGCDGGPSRLWAAPRPAADAWERCAVAQWMIAEAAKHESLRWDLVNAVIEMARATLGAIPADEPQGRDVLEAAEGWLRGDVAPAAVRTAIEAARTLEDQYVWGPRRDRRDRQASAAQHAVSACWWAATAALPGVQGSEELMSRMAKATVAVADAAMLCWHHAFDESRPRPFARRTAEMADIVRRHVTTLSFLRAVAHSTRAP